MSEFVIENEKVWRMCQVWDGGIIKQEDTLYTRADAEREVSIYSDWCVDNFPWIEVDRLAWYTLIQSNNDEVGEGE